MSFLFAQSGHFCHTMSIDFILLLFDKFDLQLTLILFMYKLQLRGSMHNSSDPLNINSDQNVSGILTKNGIKQLFKSHHKDYQFNLQVIEIDLSIQKIIFLSDGVFYVTGQLVNSALQIMQTNTSKLINSIITIRFEDIQMEEKGRLAFKLRKIQQIKQPIGKIIGRPNPYVQQKQKKLSFECANKIQVDRQFMNLQPLILIRQLNEMPLGRLQHIIKARVIKKPDKIKNFMIIDIQDEEKDVIQCCVFAELVSKYMQQLKINNWYNFQGMTLQINNSKRIKQLKITRQSIITRIKRQQQVNHQQNDAISKQSDKPKFITNEKKTQYPSSLQVKANDKYKTQKQFDLNCFNLDEDASEFFVVARLYKIKTEFRNGTGIAYEAVTRHGSIIQIVIWKQSKYLFDEKQTYEIHHLKKKVYNEKLALQSYGKFTTVKDSSYKILTRKQYMGNKEDDYVQRKKYIYKSLGANQIIYPVIGLIQLGMNTKQKSIFAHSEGYLQINLNSNSYDKIDLTKRIFFMKCKNCPQNQFNKSLKIEPRVNKDNQIVCSNCMSSLEVMWNVKCLLIDHQNELPCKINDEIAEKMIKMTARDGMNLFLSNIQKFKLIIKKTIGFRKGVFKISSKRNQKKEGERFYNICEYYPDGKKSSLERGMKQLNRTLKYLQQYKDYITIMKKFDGYQNKQPNKQQDQQPQKEQDKQIIKLANKRPIPKSITQKQFRKPILQVNQLGEDDFK